MYCYFLCTYTIMSYVLLFLVSSDQDSWAGESNGDIREDSGSPWTWSSQSQGPDAICQLSFSQVRVVRVPCNNPCRQWDAWWIGGSGRQPSSLCQAISICQWFDVQVGLWRDVVIDELHAILVLPALGRHPGVFSLEYMCSLCHSNAK